jgi:hypothetical protein
MRASGGFVAAGISAIAVSAGIAVAAVAGGSGDQPMRRTVGRAAEEARPPPQPLRVGAPLRPNLRSLPAEDVHIEVDNGAKRLRFASALANLRPGPLEVEPDDGGACPPGQRHSAQVLFSDRAGDGQFDPRADRKAGTTAAGCMLDHRTHRHWQFDAMSRYALTRPGSTRPIVSQPNVAGRVSQAAEALWRLRAGQGPGHLPRLGGRVQVRPAWPGAGAACGAPGWAVLPALGSGPTRTAAGDHESDNAAALSIVIDRTGVAVGEPPTCPPA